MRAMVGMLGLGLVLGLSACGEPEDSDSDVPVDTGERDEGCGEVTLFIDGPEEPQVGDSWTVLVRCDDATITGPVIVRVEPDDFATLDENTITFTTVGDGVVKGQAGAFRAERDVTVGQ